MLLHTKSLALTCVLLDGHLANHVAKTRLTLNNSWRIIEKTGQNKMGEGSRREANGEIRQEPYKKR